MNKLKGKQLIVFDLDGTLAESKSAAPAEIRSLLTKLLKLYQVCIISGGKFRQFEEQLLDNLKGSDVNYSNLHIMPTCGTRYFRHDPKGKSWQQIYAENFTAEEKSKIIDALNKGFDDLGYRESKHWGDLIEDRDSQITFSALGQDIVRELGQEGIRLKDEWDQDGSKKAKLQKYISKLIPEFEVRVGGGTSVDVTKKGIDKAYGIRKLLQMLKLDIQNALFLGDRLQEGGNDYPVKAMGVDSIEVSHWQDTAIVIKVLIYMAE